MAIPQKRIDRFWSAIDKTGVCWLWKKGVDNKGYGNLSWMDKHAKAHRVAWFLTFGPVPKDHAVRQKCGMRTCCNPAHLYTSKNGNDSGNWEKMFWDRIKIGGMDECWPWTAKAKNGAGYGAVRRPWTEKEGRGKQTGAHIISYELSRQARVKLQVLHYCDNPSCCNPFHLHEGTQKENMRECIERGRKKFRTGEDMPNAKLTDLIVSAARKEYIPYNRKHGVAAMAKRYGVDSRTLFAAVSKIGWKHVS